MKPAADIPGAAPSALSDPITFAVIMHGLATAAAEMTTVLTNGARSTIISIARDHSASIYDNAKQMLYQNNGLPIHTVGGRLNLDEITRIFGEDIHDGDVFMVNDPFMGTTHNADLTVLMPVFYRGNHLFWTVVRAHQNNTGEAGFGQVSINVWQDGIQIPPVKIFDRGREVSDVVRLYLRNVRLPDWLEADLRAMVGAVRTGGRRLIEMVEYHGVERVQENLAELIDYADRRTSADIRAIPDGAYEGEAWIDSDGRGSRNTRIHCVVTIEDDVAYVDFAGSDPQVGGHGNATRATLEACGSIPILTLVDGDIPRNEGCMRHIKVSATPGSVALAQWPHSTWHGTVNPGDALILAAWKAMTQAAPSRVPAGWGTEQGRVCMGVDKRFDPPRPFYSALLVSGSGGGATDGYDGWPLTFCVCALGGLRNESVEMLELMTPIVVDHNEFLCDAAGAGEFVGGWGTETVVRPIDGVIYMSFISQGNDNPPFGALGGRPGSGGYKYKEDRTGKRTFYLNSPPPDVITEDDRYVIASTGGGGFGSPLDRDQDKVAEDVRDGYFSVETARDQFGVVLDPTTGELDRAATEALRAAIRSTETIWPWLPRSPGEGKLWSTRYREGDEIVREEMPAVLKLGLPPDVL